MSVIVVFSINIFIRIILFVLILALFWHWEVKFKACKLMRIVIALLTALELGRFVLT